MSIEAITPLASGLAVAAVNGATRATPITPVAAPSPAGADAGVAAVEAVPPSPAQMALEAMVAEALPLQDSLASLLADLSAASTATALSPDARATAQAILTAQTPLGPQVTASDVQAAVANSGLFLEANLAAALLARISAPDLSGDLKGLLLQLSGDLSSETSLENLAGLQAATPQGSTAKPAAAPGRRDSMRALPPARGGPIAGQPASRPRLEPPVDEADANRALGEHAEAALARLQLSQIASLPKPGEPTCWCFELPVVSPDGRSIAQFEIRRDGSGAEADGQPIWRARFSMHTAPSGPVHAEVVLSGGRTRVTLWAEGAAAREAMAGAQGELAATLSAESAGGAAVRILSGRPPAPTGKAGLLVDQAL